MLGGVGVVVVWVHQTEKFRSTPGRGVWEENSEVVGSSPALAAGCCVTLDSEVLWHLTFSSEAGGKDADHRRAMGRRRKYTDVTVRLKLSAIICDGQQ